MSNLVYSQETMQRISFFESLTGARVKDFFDDSLSQTTIIVENGDIAKAIGKGGRNIKKIEGFLKRKIKIVEFSTDLLTFVSNLIYPSKIKNSSLEEGIITLIPLDNNNRGLLIGKAAQKLRNYEKIVQRYFDLKEIKVT